MTLPLYIRKAEINDALDIKKVHQQAYQVSYRGYLPDAYLDSLSITEDVLQRTKNYLQTTACYVAEYQHKIIAFAYIMDLCEDTFEINALYVAPDYQKNGAGSALVNYLCEAKKQAGFKNCIVWTMKNGPSLGFYKKLCFKTTANEKTWKFNIKIIELLKIL